MVGGLKSFHQEKPSSIDDKCKKCLEHYQTAFETNTVAIDDFYAFVDQYLGAKKRIRKYNRGILKKYNSKYKTQTAGMNSSMRSKLKEKIKENPLLTSNEVTEVFSGFKEGLGDISYSFNQSVEDLTPLKGYVNEIYASYYAINSLYNGATPYKYCYGASNDGYPSEVNIKSGNSDVIVTIKKQGKVYRHAYIKAYSNYTFKVADGSYNVYFYYGKGWNPKKFMKNTNCGRLVGGFVSNESVGKDMYLSLSNQYMTYTLTSVKNGNFSPKTSSIDEAF